MDRGTLYIEFAYFYFKVKPIIIDMSLLSNTYGSFRRVPLSKFEPYHTLLFYLYQKYKKVFRDISNIYNCEKTNPEEKEYINYMLIFINSIVVLLIYFGYDIEL